MRLLSVPSALAATPLCNVLYLVGDNDLEASLVQDVEEIISNQAAMTSSSYLPLVFLDRFDSPTGTSAPIAGLLKDGQPAPYFPGIRYLKKNFQAETLEVHREINEAISDSHDVMTNFFVWAFETCRKWDEEAELFVVFGGHGAGWKGIGGDFDGMTALVAPEGTVSGFGETRGFAEADSSQDAGTRRLTPSNVSNALRQRVVAAVREVSGRDAGLDGSEFVEVDDTRDLALITRAAPTASSVPQADGVRRLFAQTTSAKAALRQAMGAAGVQQLDVLGFDACIMGTYSVFGQFADLTRWMMASESTEPKHGWDFSKVVPDTAISMARDLLDGFIDFEIDGVQEAPKTLALVQSSDFLAFQTAWEELALHLTAGLHQEEKSLLLKLARARGASLSFAGVIDNFMVSPPSSADMGDFLKEFSTSCGTGGGATTLLNTATSAYTGMIENGSIRVGVGSPARATGLSVLFPTRQAEAEHGVWSDNAAAIKAATPAQQAWAAFLDFFVTAPVGVNRDVACVHLPSSAATADSLIVDVVGQRVRGVSYFAATVAPTTESFFLDYGYEWDFENGRRLSPVPDEAVCTNCTSSDPSAAARSTSVRDSVVFFGGRVYGTIDDSDTWVGVWDGRFHMFAQDDKLDDVYVDMIDDRTMVIPVLWWPRDVQPPRNAKGFVLSTGAFAGHVVVGLGDRGRSVTAVGMYCRVGSTIEEIPREYGGSIAPIIPAEGTGKYASFKYLVGGFQKSVFDWRLPIQIGYYMDSSCFTKSFSAKLLHRLTAKGTMPARGPGMWRHSRWLDIVPPEWEKCGEWVRSPVDVVDCVGETRFAAAASMQVVSRVDGVLESVHQLPVPRDVTELLTPTARWVVDEIGSCLKEDQGQTDSYLEAEFENGNMRLDLRTQELRAHCVQTSAQEVVGSRTDLELWERDQDGNCPVGALLGRHVNVTTTPSVNVTHSPNENSVRLFLDLSVMATMGMSVRAAGACSFEKQMLIHEQPRILFNECVGVVCFSLILQYQLGLKALGAPAHSSFEYSGSFRSAGEVVLQLETLHDVDLSGIAITEQVDSWVVNGESEDGASSWVMLELTPVLTVIFAPHSYVSMYFGVAGHLTFTGTGSYQKGDGAALPPLDAAYPRNCTIQLVAPATSPVYGGAAPHQPKGPGPLFSDSNPRECLSASALVVSSMRFTVRELPLGTDLSLLRGQMCTSFADNFLGWMDTSSRGSGWMTRAQAATGALTSNISSCVGQVLMDSVQLDKTACDKFLDSISSDISSREPVPLARKVACAEISSVVVADSSECSAASDKIDCDRATKEAEERFGLAAPMEPASTSGAISPPLTIVIGGLLVVRR